MAQNPNQVRLPYTWTVDKVRSNLGVIPTFQHNGGIVNGSTPKAQNSAPAQIAGWQLPQFPITLR